MFGFGDRSLMGESFLGAWGIDGSGGADAKDPRLRRCGWVPLAPTLDVIDGGISGTLGGWATIGRNLHLLRQVLQYRFKKTHVTISQHPQCHLLSGFVHRTNRQLPSTAGRLSND